MSQEYKKQELAARPRRVNLDSLPPERVDELSAQIGQKIGQELAQTGDKIKKMLAIYGLDMKLTYVLFPMGTNPFETQPIETPAVLTEEKPKKPRARKASKRATKE